LIGGLKKPGDRPGLHSTTTGIATMLVSIRAKRLSLKFVGPVDRRAFSTAVAACRFIARNACRHRDRSSAG
jgi:hypothetical protein